MIVRLNGSFLIWVKHVNTIMVNNNNKKKNNEEGKTVKY